TWLPIVNFRCCMALVVLLFLCVLRFFFDCVIDHRVLHSFPTRRSSDLAVLWIDHIIHAANDFVLVVDRRNRVVEQATRIARDGRSEEHTSELQSLAYLVCRLLLEKKKNPARITRSALAMPRPDPVRWAG